jgi:uncharacterized protein YndB with AHSA1/START domain
MATEKNNTNTADRELSVSRLLNAPIELVWEVFTKPEHIKNWWGPNGFTNTIDRCTARRYLGVCNAWSGRNGL